MTGVLLAPLNCKGIGALIFDCDEDISISYFRIMSQLWLKIIIIVDN